LTFFLFLYSSSSPKWARLSPTLYFRSPHFLPIPLSPPLSFETLPNVVLFAPYLLPVLADGLLLFGLVPPRYCPPNQRVQFGLIVHFGFFFFFFLGFFCNFFFFPPLASVPPSQFLAKARADVVSSPSTSNSPFFFDSRPSFFFSTVTWPSPPPRHVSLRSFFSQLMLKGFFIREPFTLFHVYAALKPRSFFFFFLVHFAVSTESGFDWLLC